MFIRTSDIARHVLLLCILLACNLYLVAQRAEKNDSAKPRDAFVGIWNLRSHNEVLEIRFDGTRYTLTRSFPGITHSGSGVDIHGTNDGALTTTMDGKSTTWIDAKGSPTNEIWRVKRVGASRFDVDINFDRSFFEEVSYQVSHDGKTLTRQVISGPEHRILIFDLVLP